MTALIIIGVVALILVLMYNSLVKSRNYSIEAEKQIDVALQDRAELIPNLVATVKGYAKHESDVLRGVTEARSAFANATTLAERNEAINQFNSSLPAFMATAESYPELRASENFAKLQDSLTDTQQTVFSMRRHYNSTTNDYNTKVQSFPTNILAGIFGFKVRELLEVPEELKKNPKVEF